ncbi:ATP-dependent zinc protease [Seongchinamella sediminis]|uniref:ATP-dependent zinc protease n=1 Tax=Seongchinamella sediminis TaxID=2283635 RepID=A0A3L7DXZ4_9GAMM|nr:ATP-dependent zinc protease [Seongchinamella sediminis]RLQ22066.1 ATP-dependent zinc protease [Seongchinamella sediminis]
MSADKVILGWREWLGFPDLGIASIKAKVDTGARTSCLHAFYVKSFERDGAQWIRFGIHPNQRDNETELHCEAPVKDRRIVRDSGGHEETRYVIETTITVGSEHFAAEVTLTDRDSMKFRALLGRTAIRKNHLVDPGRSFVQGRHKKPKVQPAG